jgi:hypothetical protein
MAAWPMKNQLQWKWKEMGWPNLKFYSRFNSGTSLTLNKTCVCICQCM